MKPILISFKMFILQILKDRMLIAVLFAPVLAACFFRFAVPQAEEVLCGYLKQPAVLSGYYLLFDLFLSMITPYIFCFASAMVMLTEYDENMIACLAVTPVGKTGYFVSRLVLPAVISYFVSVVLMVPFSLTHWQLSGILAVCFLSCLSSMAVALLLFSFSHNRVEGMATAKLSGLLMVGLPVPFFLTSKVQYLFSFLPSFWIGKLGRENDWMAFLCALLLSILWIYPLFRRYKRKIQ